MISLAEQGCHTSKHRSHTRSGSNSIFGAFCGTYFFDQVAAVRVGITRINISFLFFSKYLPGLFSGFKSKTGRKVKGCGMFSLVRGGRSYPYSLRSEERRVGKECRDRRAGDRYNKK